MQEEYFRLQGTRRDLKQVEIREGFITSMEGIGMTRKKESL